jgi:hypothetical protein
VSLSLWQGSKGLMQLYTLGPKVAQNCKASLNLALGSSSGEVPYVSKKE